MAFNGNEFLHELSKVGYVPKRKAGKIESEHPLYVSTTVYAKRVGLSVSTVRRYFKKGILVGIRDDNRISINVIESDNALLALQNSNVSDISAGSLSQKPRTNRKVTVPNSDSDIASKKRALKSQAYKK